MSSQSYGVSFSVKQCRSFGVDWRDCLDWALEQGWRHFRLMSYWNEIERSPGVYDFANLDEQILRVGQSGGTVSLCLGVKQPRWPEYHWPSWTKDLPPKERDEALLRFVEAVVRRYRHLDTITSYQLENEALLRGFGKNIQIDRGRLRREYELVKQLDTTRPVIMTTSNSWGLPVRRPIPDVVGFSMYAVMYQKGRYRKTIHRPWLHKLRAQLLRLFDGRQSFIHELQLEPWGPQAIWEMPPAERARSMNPAQIAKNLQDAKNTGLTDIDLWGLEWWYVEWINGHTAIWDAVKQGISY